MIELTPDMNGILTGDQALLQKVRYQTSFFRGDIPYSSSGLNAYPFSYPVPSISLPLPVDLVEDEFIIKGVLNVKVTG